MNANKPHEPQPDDENRTNRSDQGAVKFWRAPALEGLELLQASYGVQEFPRHRHEEYILGVMVRGVEGLRLGGAAHLAPEGSILMIPPGTWHANYAVDDSGFAYRTLYPSVELVMRCAQEITGKSALPLFRQPVVVEDEPLRRLLLGLHLALEQPASALEQQARFLDSLTYLLAHHSADRSVPPPTGREHRYVRSVRDFIEANYTENVSLAELGDLTGISPYHLLRMFREEVGLPPHEYLTQLRIAEAKRLLRGEQTAGQVAAEVGFVDQSHLTRHFKRIVGLTPGQFASDRKNR